MRIPLILAVVLFATMLGAQNAPDETAIRKVIEDEETAWNNGDAEAYSRNFATDGTFTNILGMFFTGHQAFLDRHEEIFKGMFRGTVLRQDIVSVKFERMWRLWRPLHGCRASQSLVRPQARIPTQKGAFVRGYCKCWRETAANGESRRITIQM
jgi:hypothetical protein